MNYTERTAIVEEEQRLREARAFDALKTFDFSGNIDTMFDAGRAVHSALTLDANSTLEGILEQLDAQLEFVREALALENKQFVKSTGMASMLLSASLPLISNMRHHLYTAQKLAALDALAIKHLRRIAGDEAK